METTIEPIIFNRITYFLKLANIAFSSVNWNGKNFSVSGIDPLKEPQAMAIIDDVVRGIKTLPVYADEEVASAFEVDHITIKRVQDRIRPDGDETLKLGAELREMKVAIYAVLKLVVAVIVPTMTTQQKTNLKPLLDQVNASISLTDEIIAIRDEGEAFKQANGLT